MKTESVRDQSIAERERRRTFWLDWVERSHAAIKNMIAETAHEPPAVSDAVYECVYKLINIQEQLADILGIRADQLDSSQSK
jgi:hypothetical protein